MVRGLFGLGGGHRVPRPHGLTAPLPYRPTAPRPHCPTLHNTSITNSMRTRAARLRVISCHHTEVLVRKLIPLTGGGGRRYVQF